MSMPASAPVATPIPAHRPWPVAVAPLAAVPLLLAVLLLLNPDFWERTFFLNELLCLLGALVLIYRPRIPASDGVAQAALWLLLYGLLRVALSPLHASFPPRLEDALRVTLQQSAMVYSILAFFIGRAVAPYLHRSWPYVALGLVLVWAYALLIMPTLYADVLDSLVKNYLPLNRFAPPVLIPLTLIGLAAIGPVLGVLLSMALIAGFALAVQGITGLAAVGVLPLFALLPRRVFWLLAGLGVAAFAAVVIWLWPYLAIIRLEGDFNQVMAAHPILSVDDSITWRLVFLWQCLEDLPRAALGTGVGSPLLDYYPVDTMKLDRPLLPWTMSPHNSLLAVLGRLGLPGAALLLLCWGRALDHYLRHRQAWRQARREPLAWSVMVLIVVALVNPFLDTPLHAGSHWFVLGVYAAVAQQVAPSGGRAAPAADQVLPSAARMA